MKPNVSKALASRSSGHAVPRSYDQLLERVRETLEAGRGHARRLLEEIHSRMFWETGRWIDLYLKYEKKTPGRAPYGEKVISKLAGDLAYDKNYLYDSLNVYRNNPIFRTYGKLPAGHHRMLLLVKDAGLRKTIAVEAEKEGWTRRELTRRIRGGASLSDGRNPEVSASSPALAAPVSTGRTRTLAPGSFNLRARKGKLRHYRIAERNRRLFLDLGFRDFRELAGSKGKFQDGDIVEGTSFDQLTKKPGAAAADLYTYQAEVLRLPDADTYWLFIRKGFGGFRDDRIRLRGIDSPEINTPEGRAAKAFVEKLLTLSKEERTKGSGPYREVLITTTKTPDKWDRYLVDLYFEKDGREIYLNRLLLEKGHARPYKE